MVRRRGNPDWGKPVSSAPAGPSEFEMFVKRLRLAPESYASSAALKDWCKRNRNRCYVPEWLLEEWGIAVEGQDIA
jgi:hypothetical protein